MDIKPSAYIGQAKPDRIDLLAAAQEEVARLGPDLRSAVRLLCAYTIDITGSDGAALYLCEGDELVCVAGAGRTEALVGLRVTAEKLFAGRSLGQDEPQVCHDTLADDRVNDEAAQRLGIRSLFCQPVRVGSIAAGVLEASSTNVAAFDPEAADSMRLLGGLVAAAFRNAAHMKAQRPDGSDPITGLPDPATYRQRLALEVERSKRTDAPLGLAIVRLLGYYDGDALAVVLHALKQLRAIDEAFVVDGGTFAIVLPNTSEEGALIVARKIAAAVMEPLAEVGVVVRIGAAQRGESTADELHDAAYQASMTSTGRSADTSVTL